MQEKILPAIIRDQNRTLFKKVPVILVVNLPLIVGLVWIYWPWVNHYAVVGWASAMLLVIVVRFLLYFLVYKKTSEYDCRQSQMYIFAINSGVSGFLWGVAGIIFFVEGRLDLQLVILLVIVLKGIGSVSVVTVYLPAFYAYFPPSIMPISLMFLIQQASESKLIGAIMTGYFLSLMVFSRHINRTLLKSFRLQYENESLLEKEQHQRKLATEANKAKTRFLAAASHDLRQPIHTLNLYNGLLSEKIDEIENSAAGETKSVKEIKNIVNSNQKTIENLQALLGALLDISKLDAGVIEVNKVSFDMMKIINVLKNDYHPVVAEKNKTRTVELKWPEESVFINSDYNLIEQILRNLISNALRYTDSGLIGVRVIPRGNRVKISVEDSGIGIAKEKQQDIFSEFYQLEHQCKEQNGHGQGHGLGLGLSIVKRVMPLIGSEIHLESEPGAGSVFYFYVDKGSPPEEVIQVGESVVNENNHPGKTVLIVEDNPEAANAMSMLLDNWGYKTIVTENITQTRKLLAESRQKIDVIISDLQLNEKATGIDVIKLVREVSGKEIPALIVTGDIQPDHLAEVEREQIPLLHKPVAPAKLRAFMKHQLPL